MKAMVCEMCNGNDLVKQDGMFVCQSCGTKYSTEEAKKLMIEGTVDVQGTVRIDSSDELANLYQIARRAKNNNNTENAAKYYEKILIKDPSNWEPNFYTVYFQSMNCRIADIHAAATNLTNCEKSVIQLIKDNVSDLKARENAVIEISNKLIHISNMLFQAARNHYFEISADVRNKYTQEYVNNGCAARDILYNYGELILSHFQSEYINSAVVPCWKAAIEEHNHLMPHFLNKKNNKAIITSYINRVKQYDPTYKPPKSSGCYVATAVYGSYDCPQVWTLRRYRDNELAKTWYGRAFIKTYYAISPTLVRWFGETAWFKKMWTGRLNKMVATLQRNGYESTPYEDKSW